MAAHGEPRTDRLFSVREAGGRGGRGRRVLGVLGVGPGSLRGVGRGGCSEPVGKCCLSYCTRVRERNPIVVIQTKFTHSPTASEHHPRPKVAGLLGTTRLTPRRRLTGRWRAPARPSKLQRGMSPATGWPRAACPSPCKHCGQGTKSCRLWLKLRCGRKVRFIVLHMRSRAAISRSDQPSS